MKTRRIYRFGAFRLDATVKVLLKDGEPVHAPRKAVETLLALVESTGQVLTKEELMTRLWPDRVVNEANLAQNIAVVRKAMQVERGTPGYIETFPGAGYRVLGPVTAMDEPLEVPQATPATVAAEPAKEDSTSRTRLRMGIALLVLLFLVSAWLIGRRSALSREPRRFPVTRLAGKEQQPAISTDGKSVAFVWQSGERARGAVWVQREGRRAPERVSPDDGAVYDSPAWSPDGRHLAYLRFQGTEGSILVSPVEGGVTRTVAPVFASRYGLPNGHLDWSPDGRYVAVDDASSPGQALGIFLVSLENGEKKRLTRPDDVFIGDLDPRFSPDGGTISFIRAFHRARQELFTVPTRGGEPRQVTRDGRQVSGQDWMGDGVTLVFGSDRTGEFRLWKIKPAAARSKPEATAIYGDFPLQPAVARGAEVLVYSVLQQDANIWRLDLEAPAGGSDGWVRLIASSGQDASPQYSPHGDRICFRSDRSGEEQLWVSGSDGGNPAQVTQGLLRPSVGRWSPDGRSVVFNNAATTELFLARLGEGDDWSVRPVGLNGVHPVFSPDGRWIYAGTMNSIIRIPAQGGTSSEVAKMMGISLGVSSDGRFVYFVREPSGTALWRVEVSSGRTEKVLDGLVPFCSSCWALSPSGIYYLGNRSGSLDRQALFYHDFATGRERVVADYPETISPIGTGPFSLSPDGRYLLCVRGDPSNSDIFRVEPFR